MTTTNILHVIADLLLMVIVFWYDWRLCELSSEVSELDERISKIEQSIDAHVFVEWTHEAEDEFTRELFEKVMQPKCGETYKPIE